jgi:hypothetical protein
MKTLKKFREESELFYKENAATYFAASYSKKMGGTQTITFEDNFLPEIKLDDRLYYAGRGARYNNNKMHEHIKVFISKKVFYQKVNDRANCFYKRQLELAVQAKQLSEFCKQNNIDAKNYSSLVNNSIFFKIEKKSKIEKELNVDLSDFFNASGKTYFFAETKIGLLEFYHNHRQSYSFNIVTQERVNEFKQNRKSWINAPFAADLGQTDNENLFVC